MNNAFLDDEIVVDTTVLLRERKVELTRIIEAVNHLASNEDWQVLKELLFDGQVEKLEKNLLAEAKNIDLNAPKIQRLNGQLEMAKRFDLYKLAETYKLELNHITKKLNENG